MTFRINLELVVVSKASVKYIAIGFILLHGLAVLAHATVTDYYLQFTLKNPVRVCFGFNRVKLKNT